MPVCATWITLDLSARRKRLSVGMSGRSGRSVTPVVVVAHANTDAYVLQCITKTQRQGPDVRGMRSVQKKKYANQDHANLSGLSGAIAMLLVRKMDQVWFWENVVGNAPVHPLPHLTVRKIVNFAAQSAKRPALRIALATASVTVPQKTVSIHPFVVWFVFVTRAFQDLHATRRQLRDELKDPKTILSLMRYGLRSKLAQKRVPCSIMP